MRSFILLWAIFSHLYIVATHSIHWTPPKPETWEKLNITKTIKRFWEFEWSKSTYAKECSGHVLQMVPVYFWPGERVDLPCKMCELAMAYNGKIKYWAKAEKMDEFLKAAQLNVISREDLYEQVINSRQLEDPLLNEMDPLPEEKRNTFKMINIGPDSSTSPPLPHPVYLQRDGKLSIIRANPSSQGVYFCYDEFSIGNINLFFVVLAMTPPISIFDKKQLRGNRARFYSDSCDSGGNMHIEPSFNWRFRFLPTFRDHTPFHCVTGSYCSHYERWETKRKMCITTFSVKKMTVITSVYGDSSMDCFLDKCSVNIPPIELPNSLFDPGLNIELRWDGWSGCHGNVPVQRREAHCYVTARPGFTVDEDAEELASNVDQFNWMVRLGRLVRSEALRKTGVRLHSSVIASYLYREEVIRGCGGIPEGIRIAADEVWRKYFLFPMGIRDPNGKHVEKRDNLHFSLKNPFQACLRYEKSGKNHEILIGTFMIETQDCF